MKAILYRMTGQNTANGHYNYDKIELAADAGNLSVNGEIVTVELGGHVRAATKLGERDYIKFED